MLLHSMSSVMAPQSVITHVFYLFSRWILKALGDEMTDEEIDDIIAEIDTDGSGTVDYNGMSHCYNLLCHNEQHLPSTSIL